MTLNKAIGLVVMALQAGSVLATMEIHSDPIRPSVDVEIDISGVWGDTCVPDRPSSVLFEPNRIEFEIGTSLHNGGCDFLATAYELTVDKLNIPVSAPVQTGPVIVDSRAYNHHFSAGADLVLPGHVSEFVYLVDDHDQILVYRADAWELVEVLRADSANRIISDQTNLFVWSGPSKFEGRVSGYVDANFNMMVGHEGAREPVDIVTVPDDGLFDAFHYDSYVAFEDWLGSYRFEPVDLPVPPGGLARSDDSVFVTLPAMNAVMVINRYDGTVEQTITVSGRPTLAHQNTGLDRVIVSNADERSVSLIDSLTGSVITTINVGSNIVQFTYSNTADRFFAVLENGTIRGISALSGQLTDEVSFDRPATGVSMNQAQDEMYALLSSNAGTDIAILDPLTLQTMGTRHLPTTALSIAHYTSESYWMPAPNGSAPVAVPANGTAWLLSFVLLLATVAWMHLRSSINLNRAKHRGNITTSRLLFLALVAVSLPAQSVVEVLSSPLRPPDGINLRISSVWNDSCVPENLSGVRYLSGEIVLESGLSITDYGGCDFGFTPYSFDITRLNIRADADIQSGPVTLSLWRTFPPASIQTTIELPAAVAEFAYLTNEERNVLIYRVDDWTVVDRVDVGVADRVVNDHSNIFTYWGQPDDDDIGTEPSVGYIDADMNQLIFVLRWQSLVDSLAFEQGDDHFYNDVYWVSQAYPQYLQSYRFDSYEFPVEIGGLAYSPQHIFATQPNTNSVLMVDRFSGDIDGVTFVGSGPSLAHQNSQANRIIVANQRSRSVSLLAGADGSLIATTPMGAEISQFSYSQRTDQFLAALTDNRVVAISAIDGARNDSIGFSQSVVGLSINKEGDELYVLLDAGSQSHIAVINIDTFEIRRTVWLGINATSIAHYTSTSYHLPEPRSAPIAVPVNQRWWLVMLMVSVFALGYCWLSPWQRRCV